MALVRLSECEVGYSEIEAARFRQRGAQLKRLNPSAARSLAEGLEETLTLHRLNVPDALRTSLKSTNIIESSLSRVDELSGKVKRWRGGDHLQRWTAKALLIAEKKFRKVRGHQSMAMLIDSMNPTAGEKIA
jgi:putative transposase